ncbi:MAG: sugar phosphate isomerase/epimerase [Fibrobacteres bacterium]|nr:sugar phosphate isomerase/epimerase [Fibrobacterota bacterium]
MFRLGCTSYVYPDTMLSNVEQCAGLFDDIEMIFFESEGVNNWPTAQEIDKMADILKQKSTTVTIHFPIDSMAGSEEDKERASFCEQALKLVAHTAPLDPFAYILHLEGVDRNASHHVMLEWRKRTRDISQALLGCTKVDPAKVAVENLNYPWEWNQIPARESGFSFCLDFGHFCRYGVDWRKPFRMLLPETRVIHLHGWNGEKDHVSLEEHDRKDLEELAIILKREFSGVVSLELFETKAVFDSKKLWEELCR